MTLDTNLIEAVDKVVKKLKTTRSAFTRKALNQALLSFETEELEKKHIAGYARKPVKKNEFSAWEKEQDWGDT